MARRHFQLQPPPRTSTGLPASPLLQDFPLPQSSIVSKQRQNGSDVRKSLSPVMSNKPAPSSNSRWAENTPSNPANVHPPPAYVAGFGASQVVSDAKRHFSDDEEDEPEVTKAGLGEMEFSPAALVLINAFLDQLLFSILSNAKSTTLTALRPAVTEVLKARLASEAIASAEEELQELLAGGDEEENEMNALQSKSEHSRAWDTELVWKRTRLRVMVYIRLGEMEDDDEERYVREDKLFAGNDRRFSQSTGLVSWAAAIFLTSVVEYVAEQVLKVAGQAAVSRARRRSRHLRTSLKDPEPGTRQSRNVTPGPGGETTVEDHDMEKVALNSTLGRLWRTWRKSTRVNSNASSTDMSSPATAAPSAPSLLTTDRAQVPHTTIPNFSHRSSRDLQSVDGVSPSTVVRNGYGMPADSVSALDDGASSRPLSSISSMDQDVDEPDVRNGGEEELEKEDEELHEPEHPEYVIAANIPLPLAGTEKDDIAEIEVPGLARDPDEPVIDATKVLQVRLRRGSWSGGFAPLERVVVAVAEPDAGVVKDAKVEDGTVESEAAEPELAQEKEADAVRGEEADIARATPVAQEDEDAQDSIPAKDTDTTQGETVTQPEVAARDADVAEAAGPEAAQTATPEQQQPEKHLENSAIVVKPQLQRLRSSSVPTRAKSAAMHDEDMILPSIVAPADTVVEDVRDQQKLNAAEMAVHKRVVSFGKRASGEQTHEEASRNGNLEESKKDKETVNKGLVGGAIAAASAAAATAAALVSSSTSDGKDVEGENTSKDAPAADIEDTEDTENAVGESQRPEEESGPGRSVSPSGKSPNGSIRGLEEGGDEPRIMMSRKVSMSPPATPVTLVRTHQSSGSKDSNTSFALEDEYFVQKPTAMPRHLSTDLHTAEPQDGGIGVARTSDAAVSSPDTPERKYQQARDSFTGPAPRRQSRIILAANTSDAPSPIRRESQLGEAQVSATTPEAFLHGRALSYGKTPPVENIKPENEAAREEQITAQQPSFNGPGLNGNEPLAAQSMSDAFTTSSKLSQVVNNDGSPTPRRKSSFIEDVDRSAEETPLAPPKMAVTKQKESSPIPLTSANIKGPEDFEMFVQGGDTVKYTLTPENVRGNSSSVNPVPYPRLVRTVTSDKKDPDPAEDARTGRSQKSKHATAASSASAGNESEPSRTSRDTKRRSISRPTPRNTSVHRRSGLMAREPQVVTESTRDFADWIRSTGPSKEPEIIPIFASSLSRTASLRSSSPGGASIRSLNRSMHQSAAAPPVPPVPSGRSSSRPNMQPKPATSTADGSAELIDFIRNGPTGSQTEDYARRISRSLAPVRTTSNSDQLNDWVQASQKLSSGDGKLSSDRSTSSYTAGGRSSSNSKSALLASSNANQTAHLAYSGQPQSLSNLPPNITKKRVRNKDPYAIDFDDLMNDDDDDDELLTALPKARRPEESLIEFLRNTEPDVQAANRASLTNGPPNSPPQKNPLRKVSNQALNADATRRPSAISNNSVSIVPPSRTSSAPRTAGTTTIAYGSMNKTLGSSNAPEPRTNPARNSDTTDLASFLRTSGPTSTSTSTTTPAATAAATAAARANASAPVPNARPASRVPAPAPKYTPPAQKPERKKSGRLSVFWSSFFSSSSGKGKGMKGTTQMQTIGRQYV